MSGATQGQLRPEEQRAADVVRRLLQAPRQVVARDVGGAGGMYDFDVVDGDGVVVASVEVTMLADEAKRRTWNDKTLDPHRRGPGLQHAWSVAFSKMETVKLKAVMPKVRAYLLALEAEGISELDPDDEHPVQTALEGFGVFGVATLNGFPAGTIVLSSIGAGTWSLTVLEDAIEVRAAEKARQLEKAASDVERILFVWIDATRQDVLPELDRWAADPVFGPPPRTIDLPDVVDTVIVGAPTSGGDRFYRWPGFSPFVP